MESWSSSQTLWFFRGYGDILLRRKTSNCPYLILSLSPPIGYTARELVDGQSGFELMMLLVCDVLRFLRIDVVCLWCCRSPMLLSFAHGVVVCPYCCHLSILLSFTHGFCRQPTKHEFDRDKMRKPRVDTDLKMEITSTLTTQTKNEKSRAVGDHLRDGINMSLIRDTPVIL